jgi:serine protease AprX
MICFIIQKLIFIYGLKINSINRTFLMRLKKIKIITFFSFLICYGVHAQVHDLIIDPNVSESFSNSDKNHDFTSVILFFKSNRNIPGFLEDMASFPEINIESLNFMPAVVITCPRELSILQRIREYPDVVYIALNRPAAEKIEISPNTKKPKIQFRYPGIDKWWAHDFKGQSAIIGIIDSGIDSTHQAFVTKNIIINKGKNSGFFNYPHGIRTPHGTGVACIYAGYPLEEDDHIRGVSYQAPIILSTIAGEGEKTKENFWLTYSGLNWMFSLKPLRPKVINYSFGNGAVSCATCPDWSGMSKVVDYIVNTYQLLWVTSAGNQGYVKQSKTSPFASTLTIPADNYNAITVANMNMYHSVKDDQSPDRREKHMISDSSSRGPTLLGRKKPDITAPGNDTYTCAPDPRKFKFSYPEQMKYEQGYRLMGGTSAAAPHVGGAVLLIQEAGISNPMAIKGLLINSADTWTDSNKPGPNDPAHQYNGGHHPIQGSEWNPTYGWGYLNMENAFNQRTHIILNKLTLKRPVIEYRITLDPLDKVTLVHERRVGFSDEGKLWNLSHLKLELLDSKTGEQLAVDQSSINNVHQVSLCSPAKEQSCRGNPREIKVVIALISPFIEGAKQENFALVYS